MLKGEELAPVKSGNLWKVGKTLSKSDAANLAFSLHALSLAKNIKLMEGTIQIWEMCLLEDVDNFKFEFIDFLQAIKAAVRIEMYNRIDYADIYKLATGTYFDRKKVEQVSCDKCHALTNYTIEDLYRNVFKASASTCHCSTSLKEQEQAKPYWKALLSYKKEHDLA
jgi:hypothetical protein